MSFGVEKPGAIGSLGEAGTEGSVRSRRRTRRATFIHGINRGVLLPPGLDEQWLISVMHDDADAMRYAAVFDEFVQELTG